MGELRDKHDIWEHIDCEACGAPNIIYAEDILENNEEVITPLSQISNSENRFRVMCDLLDEPYTITKEDLFKRLDDLLQ